MEKGKGLKINWFWVVLVLAIVAAGIWYWWKNMKPDTQTKEEEQKPPVTPSPTNTTANTNTNSASGNGGFDGCGGLEAVIKKFVEDSNFRNQSMGPDYRGKNKCQTALLQKILNKYESAGLLVDGDFGPKTLEAVKKAFGKTQLNLNDVDQKYKLTSLYKGGDWKTLFELAKPW